MSAVETTIDLADYSRYCGPVSLAALLAPMLMTRMDAAQLLVSVQRRRGLITAPGTEPAEMALALAVVGFGAWLYDTSTGQVLGSAMEIARKTPPQNPASKSAAHDIIAASPAAERDALWEHFHNRYADKCTLREWLPMPGAWLVVVDAAEDKHWLALRNGSVISDDRAFDDCRVTDALRLYRSRWQLADLDLALSVARDMPLLCALSAYASEVPT
jgi:hypothetical protein